MTILDHLLTPPDFDLDTIGDIDLSDLEFDMAGFDLTGPPVASAPATDTVVVRRYPRPHPHLVAYERAVDLVAALPSLEHDGDAVFALVSGNFIFGDLLEALVVDRNWLVTEMVVATLSLGKDNVDSLANLTRGGYVERLSLIVSDYWYAHERRAAGGVPYIMATLGGTGFAFAAAGLHTKVTLIRTACGKELVLHGSANLRSSRNLEQVMIEHNPDLFAFNHRWTSTIVENFSITTKSQRGEKLWQTLQEPAKKQSSPTGEPARPPQPNATPNAKSNG